MTFSPLSLTRRSALKLGLGGLAAAGLAQPAFAAPGISYPMRIAYARLSPAGFVQIRWDEQEAWTRMATRLGGLISALTPLQPAGMLGGGLPKIDGNANCVLVARQMAQDAGYNQMILYATLDGQPPRGSHDNWFWQTFNDLLADIAKDGRATGEAQLLLTGGGMPLASASAMRPRATCSTCSTAGAIRSAKFWASWSARWNASCRTWRAAPMKAAVRLATDSCA